jgi:hypothetical protein
MEPVASGGRRHKRSAKKLRLVKKKTVRAMLAKKGLKMRGGGPTPAEVATGGVAGPALAPAAAGGRRRHGKTHRRSRKGGLFGKMMKF